MCEIDFRWQRDDAEALPQLIEVNPRFWGGLFQSTESGLDFPWLLYQLSVSGKAPEGGEARIGTRTKVPGRWLVSAVQEFFESDQDFNRLEDAWQGVWSAPRPDGQTRGRLTQFGEAMVQMFTPAARLERLRGRLDEARDAGRPSCSRAMIPWPPWASSMCSDHWCGAAGCPTS